METSAAQVIRFKHLDGTVVQRKTIQLRIEPSTITSGSFCLDGKVTIDDDNVFGTSSKKTHYMRVTSLPTTRQTNSFRIKIKSSQNQLIGRAMVTCLPDSVATSLSGSTGNCVDSSTFHASEFNLKLLNLTGDYRIRLGPNEYERTADLRSIQITGDGDINFTHFTSSPTS